MGSEVVKHSEESPREVRQSPSLKTFNTCLGKSLSNSLLSGALGSQSFQRSLATQIMLWIYFSKIMGVLFLLIG